MPCFPIRGAKTTITIVVLILYCILPTSFKNLNHHHLWCYQSLQPIMQSYTDHHHLHLTVSKRLIVFINSYWKVLTQRTNHYTDFIKG